MVANASEGKLRWRFPKVAKRPEVSSGGAYCRCKSGVISKIYIEKALFFKGKSPTLTFL
jgi:hypothetical protein